MSSSTLCSISASLALLWMLICALAGASPDSSLDSSSHGTPHRELMQVQERTAGLLPPADRGLRSPRNLTRRGYRAHRTRAAQTRNLGAKAAAVSAEQVARAACGKTNIRDPECFDVLLLMLTPPSYSSNATADTPGSRAFISPAQDQGDCSACLGFAVTAAAEAVVNVHRGQSWQQLGLSEQHVSFCRLANRVNCVNGGAYGDVVASVQSGLLNTWVARDCYAYRGMALGTCGIADACPNQLRDVPTLQMAYDANALATMASAKELIMLSGGVLASMALSEGAFRRFGRYKASASGVFRIDEDLKDPKGAYMHAVFCYGWWDHPTNNEEGWWLCKNSWSPSWGWNGSFKIAYGAAYIMQPDYTYGLKIPQNVGQVQHRIGLGLAYSSTPGCLEFRSAQPVRLIKLADDLSAVAARSLRGQYDRPQLLADVITSNLGVVRDISAASRGPFRLCGSLVLALRKHGSQAPSPSPSGSGCSRSHTIQPGGNCWALTGLAGGYGLPEGDAGLDVLRQLNPGLDCNLLRVGQNVCVAGPQTSFPSPSPSSSGCSRSHTIRSGDICYNLIGLAGGYGLPEGDAGLNVLQQLNPELKCESLWLAT
ncbi:hypothetical protein COO60DRAFT_1695321 [Scenedesmus sp. NREL 46B-D3]|nr:hypothetical protein COO60DRAFT_1695321 [Scenedesmus sp. NREL 46B-D3]